MLKSKISSFYENHDKSRICQGDLLRDFKFNEIALNGDIREIHFPYIFVISQDCDLERAKDQLLVPEGTNSINQYLPNVLFLPAFVDEDLKGGEHLKNLFSVTQEKLNSDRWKIVKQNNNERYHYLAGVKELQVPDLVVDFKMYYAVDYKLIHNRYDKSYLATVSELFRERVSQRFGNYLSRIGLPELG